MGILIDASTRAIVQGVTGKQSNYQTKLMLDYGTKILAGVSPGKGGNTIDGLPVFDTVKEAVDSYSPDASIVFVPAKYAQDAVIEAIANKIKTIVVITEHIPIKDSINMGCLRGSIANFHYWSKHAWNNHARRVQTWNNACQHFWPRRCWFGL
jgi:succinyl-CoA synthetase alpha subunit